MTHRNEYFVLLSGLAPFFIIFAPLWSAIYSIQLNSFTEILGMFINVRTFHAKPIRSCSKPRSYASLPTDAGGLFFCFFGFYIRFSSLQLATSVIITWSLSCRKSVRKEACNTCITVLYFSSSKCSSDLSRLLSHCFSTFTSRVISRHGLVCSLLI